MISLFKQGALLVESKVSGMLIEFLCTFFERMILV